jgi:hypothetical protein
VKPRRLLLITIAATLLLPAAAVAQDGAADPLPEPGTILEPGRYTSSMVGPSIDFRVGEGWLAGPSGGGPIFTLEHIDTPGGVLSVTRFDGETFLDSCDPSSMTVVEPSIGRLGEIIGGNPYLNPGPPSVIEVDGYTGLVLDVGVPTYTECRLQWVLIWALPIGDGGEFVQMANQQSRFVLLDVDGDVIVVAIESFPGVPFGGFLESSMELVDSMRIEPGEYMPPEPTPSAEPSEDPEPESPSPSPEASPSPVLPPKEGPSA